MSRVDDTKIEKPNAADTMAQMPEAAQSLLVGICQSQAEAAQLMSRRARAYLELPAALSSCRTLPDVVRAQMTFIEAGWSDWLSTGQRMAAAWSSLVPTGAMPAPIGEPNASKTPLDEADPMTVWQWWRTDLKGIVPRRSEIGSAATTRNGAH